MRAAVLALIFAMCIPGSVSGQAASSPAAARQEFQKRKAEFDSTIVPAARREGELTWYYCGTPVDTELYINLFNKLYPDLRVNPVNAPGFQLRERIATESAAGRLQADVHRCGSGSLEKVLLGQRGLMADFVAPRALDPDVKYHWNPVDATGTFAIHSLLVAGIQINTSKVPRERFPRTWWDLVRDPYWVDLFKRGLVGAADPKIISFTPYVIHGLKDVHAREYGEAWVRQFASLKPKFTGFGDGGFAARGELYAVVGVPLPQDFLDQRAPLALWCPQPGCVAADAMDVIVKGARHPNAAKVFADFFFSKEAQDLLGKRGFTPARTDVAVDPARDFKNLPQMYWPNAETGKGISAAVQWAVQSKLFDY